MKKLLVAVIGLGLAFSAGVIAADGNSADAMKDKIAKALGISADQIHESPATGLYEVEHEHDFAYVTTDGKYLIQGDLVNIQTGEQITEERRRADRLLALKDLGDDNMIEFAPKPPIATKYLVTVFTDIDCPYCRKLHSEMAEYNAKGIAIRYAFFPRSGLNTPSYDKAVAVWCSADRRAALTRAKQGESITMRKCDNPVAREYKLGLALGVRGTPMMILPDGEIYPGYAPADELAEVLARMGGVPKGEQSGQADTAAQAKKT